MSGAKRILDSRWAWNWVQGSIYNRLIWQAAAEVTTQMIERLSPAAGARVLDVGSGPGYATVLFARRYPSTTITGIDYSSTQVKAARSHLASSPAPNCWFQVADAMHLPFARDSFDMVMSIASIKHWPDKVGGLEEVRRVLRPGCTAHLIEADREADRGDLASFVGALTAPWWVYRPLAGRYVERVVFGESITCAEARQLACKAGFAGVVVEKVPGHPVLRMELRKAAAPRP